jgi:hypothetical protein
MNEIVIRERFLEYLQQKAEQGVVVSGECAGISESYLRRFRDGEQGVLTDRELGQLERYLTEELARIEPSSDLGNRLIRRIEDSSITMREIVLSLGIDGNRLVGFVRRNNSLPVEDADKLLRYFNMSVLEKGEGLREALRVLLVAADATFLCDELVISFDLLKGVAEGKSFLASPERIRLWGLIEKSKWDSAGASKLKDRIWEASSTGILFMTMEKASGVSADTIAGFLDGERTLWFDEVEKLVGWLESLENTEEDTTMSKEDGTRAQAELEYLLGDEGRKRFEDLLATEAGNDRELLKGFVKVAQMAQWGSDLGLHVGVSADDSKWVVSFPDPKSKELVEVFRGQSMRDLMLILSTVRLTRDCFGLQGGNEDEEDLVVPRVLEYE